LPLYKGLIKKDDFCGAMSVAAQRFEYPDDYQTDRNVLNKRMIEWDKRRRDVVVDCKKQLWPKVKEGIDNQIATLQNRKDEFENLKLVTVSIIGGSFGDDQMQRHCVASFGISNKSRYDIIGVGFADDQKSNRVEDYYNNLANETDGGAGPKGIIQIGAMVSNRQTAQSVEQADNSNGEVSGGWGDGKDVIKGGEVRTVQMCNFNIAGPDSVYRKMGNSEFTMKVKQIALVGGEKIDLWRYENAEEGYNFAAGIEALKAKLVSEDPNKPGVN